LGCPFNPEDCLSDAWKGAKDVGVDLVKAEATGISLSPEGTLLRGISQLTDTTVGACIAGDIYLGNAFHAGVCYVATPSGQSGFTFSVGGGFGAPIGASGFAGPMFSNAHDLSDLGGPFSYGWASFGAFPAAAGVAGEVGTNARGQLIGVGSYGWTPAIPLADPLFVEVPRGSFGGGFDYAWTIGAFR